MNSWTLPGHTGQMSVFHTFSSPEIYKKKNVHSISWILGQCTCHKITQEIPVSVDRLYIFSNISQNCSTISRLTCFTHKLPNNQSLMQKKAMVKMSNRRYDDTPQYINMSWPSARLFHISSYIK